VRATVLALGWLWLALFLLAPLAIVVTIALSAAGEGMPPYVPPLQWSGGVPRLSVDPGPFQLVLTDPLYRRALAISLRIAAVATLGCLAIGYPMALAIARMPERRRNLLLLLVMLPFWTGFLMRINAWIGLLNDAGWIPRAIAALGLAAAAPRILYTDAAMYLGLVYAYLPFMVLPLYANLSRQDPVLPEAASDLGAGPMRAFLTVTLPLSLPGIAAGCALVFVPSVGEYVIPELLGGPGAQTIGRTLWSEFFDNRDWPTACARAASGRARLRGVPARVVHPARRLAARRLAAR
jgi:putrescine transport system permease protein